MSCSTQTTTEVGTVVASPLRKIASVPQRPAPRRTKRKPFEEVGFQNELLGVAVVFGISAFHCNGEAKKVGRPGLDPGTLGLKVPCSTR